MTDDNREAAERSGDNLFTRAAVVADSVSDEDRSVEVIASTEDIDRHGTIIRQNWRLEDFKRNPVVLYSHNRWDLPIGTASDIRVTDGELRAKLTFSTADLNEEADRVWRNVKAKVIRGVSVGFWPHTVTLERHDDRDVLVLDDNELFEISMTPVPSNPSCLSQMRSRALQARQAPEPQPSPAAPPSPSDPTPEQPENTRMSDDTKNKPNDATPSVARALGLPPGSSEADIVLRASNLCALEQQALAITGAQISGEAIGAIRGLQVKAENYDKLADENAKLKAERDQQKFDGLIARGTGSQQLLPPEVQHYTELFNQAKERGAGADIVAQLEGYLKVAPRKLPQRHTPPGETATRSSASLTWNGKSFADMKPLERARLAQSDPDLFRAMKEDHNSQTH